LILRGLHSSAAGSLKDDKRPEIGQQPVPVLERRTVFGHDSQGFPALELSLDTTELADPGLEKAQLFRFFLDFGPGFSLIGLGECAQAGQHQQTRPQSEDLTKLEERYPAPP
jgi:hypothetical protein